MRVTRLLKHRVGCICVVGLALGTAGCRSRDAAESVGYDFAPSDTLARTVLFKGDQLSRPQSIGVVGEWLLVADRPQPHALHVLRRSTGEYVASWGREGRGPGEFLTLWSIQAADSARAWLYDPSQSRLTLVSIPALVTRAGDPWKRSLNLHAQAVPFTALWLSDTLIVSSGTYSGGRLAIFDREGKLQRVSGPLPPTRSGVPHQVAQHAYSGTVVRHPSRPLIAIGTRHADRLEIYHVDGRPVRIGRGMRRFEPVYELAMADGTPVMGSGGDMRFGYVDVSAGSRYIYALYSGKTRDERPGKASFGGEVHVFDWAGNLRRILKLDTIALALAVDPEESALFTVIHDPEPAVLKYTLPPD